MRNLGGKLLLSASDLTRFMGCAHATTLDLMHLRGEGPTPAESSEDAALLQKQGDAHELAHLERLRSDGKKIVEVQHSGLERGAQATREALAEGPDVVFQGALVSGNWGGWSD
jgi:uncharacterized protein